MGNAVEGYRRARQFTRRSRELAVQTHRRRTGNVVREDIHITPEQCRMARAALQLTVKQLAERAGVSASLISRFEHDRLPRQTDTLERIQMAFEARGIRFTKDDGLGVQLRNI